MLTTKKILEIAQTAGHITTADIVGKFSVSRQYAIRLISELVEDHLLIKIGTTRSAFYVLPSYTGNFSNSFASSYGNVLQNQNLEEHKVFQHIEERLPSLRDLPENVHSIFTYAFSEMLNNAIEHSGSSRISVWVSVSPHELVFVVQDWGIGAFRNVMKKQKLESETAAIEDILKGKTTTMPRSHSGEGIFFTSKVGDVFILESFAYQLFMDNSADKASINMSGEPWPGTRVVFRLSTKIQRHLNDIFREYTSLDGHDNHGFDKTRIKVSLYQAGGVHISRSQARRVLSGLDKFKVIIFDFDKVTTVGQAFADEIFRVFPDKYPHIKIEAENMVDGVRFMIERAKK